MMIPTPTSIGAANPAPPSPLPAASPVTNANELVRDIIRHEIQAEANDTALWCYHDVTDRHGEQVLLGYCQTKYGTLDRLLAVNGRPLAPSRQEAEDRRIQRLISSSRAARELQEKQASDAREERKFLSLFPDAFRYQEEGQQGELMKLSFAPNPAFRPPDSEAQVLHHLEGIMVLDTRQKRLASINGHLMTRVKFWGGFLGHLDQGGTFSVVSQEVVPGDWELKSLDVEMRGKALFFKDLTIHQRGTYSDYRPVPPQTTLAQAAEMLKNGREN